MPGHSRSKNGVASLAYGAGHPRFQAPTARKTWMAGASPAMTRSEWIRLWYREYQRVVGDAAQRRVLLDRLQA